MVGVVILTGAVYCYNKLFLLLNNPARKLKKESKNEPSQESMLASCWIILAAVLEGAFDIHLALSICGFLMTVD